MCGIQCHSGGIAFYCASASGKTLELRTGLPLPSIVRGMLCNLPGPSPDSKPALLRHSDVVTFFHEV